MRLNESSLVTPEPYHIPGYCGYCPQLKYKITETIGKTTHKLLTEKDCKSKRPVLVPLKETNFENTKDAIKLDLLDKREKKNCEKKYRANMVSGYTGYIPKGQHYFGERYALFSRNAILHMEEERQRIDTSLNNLHNTVKCSTPMKPITDKKMMYFPKVLQHSLSPYTLSNNDPRKHMMSGYTGFVPRSREIIGSGYPKITNLALRHFANQCATNKILSEIASEPLSFEKPIHDFQRARSVYLNNYGMVPHYTGHIPGEKFRYGHTFGFSSSKKSCKVE
ncbi:ciliary microtubule inner protein 2B isoform X2 [Hydra vulgaris]|uniref:Ciliary microtubule inner protein 2B isoform X2 n=1 Tax=Hydra vulgaris TaxID=6087 RepID=A0ABM4BEG6_HYDVU